MKYDTRISTQDKNFDAFHTTCQYILLHLSFCYDSDYDNDVIDIFAVVAVWLKVGIKTSL